jgi:hypothetical protein
MVVIKALCHVQYLLRGNTYPVQDKLEVSMARFVASDLLCGDNLIEGDIKPLRRLLKQAIIHI